jgi:nucleoside-diphosphate-sugar epimerase
MEGPAGLRALVTGAGGFIGANVVRKLMDAGVEAHALVPPSTDLWRLAGAPGRLEVHAVDLRDRDRCHVLIGRLRPEVIFHAASPAGHPADLRASAAMVADTTQATAVLLEAAAAAGFHKFVNLGSSLEYGFRATPMKEDDPAAPSTGRGVAKAAQTLLCTQFARANRLPVVTLRPFSVYGPWESSGRLIPTLALALLHDREVRLTVPGIRHDFVFVDDVADACLRAAVRDTGYGDIVNIGSGSQWSNEEVAVILQERAGSKMRILAEPYPAQPPDTSYWVADISKAARILGWKPAHDLRAGLGKTLDWFRDHMDHYSRDRAPDVASSGGHGLPARWVPTGVPADPRPPGAFDVAD